MLSAQEQHREVFRLLSLIDNERMIGEQELMERTAGSGLDDGAIANMEQLCQLHGLLGDLVGSTVALAMVSQQG